MVTCLRVLLFHGLLCGLLLPLSGEADRDGLEDGLALITTAKGGATLIAPDGETRSAELHAVEMLTGAGINCREGAHVFLSLSNGCALGVWEDSEVHFERYWQRPFTATKENLEYEPSNSALTIQLKRGSLSFSADRVSPLSQIVIELPGARIQVHEASGRIGLDDRGARLTITTGIVSYRAPGMEEEEFINGPSIVRIRRTGTGFGPPVELPFAEAPGKELTGRLVQATRRANQRVIFKAPPEQPAIPRPILVAEPEALLRPTPRPYRYLDQ
jgi:hypothetical protein